MRLIVFPLVFLISVAFVNNLMSVEDFSTVGRLTVMSGDVSSGWFDENEHQVADQYGNYVDDEGIITFPIIQGGDGIWKNLPVWDNGTDYNVYDSAGVRVFADSEQNFFDFDFATTMGMIGIIAAGILFAGFVGARFMASGENDFGASMIWKGTVLLSIWTTFSLMSYDMFLSVPYFGGVFYFFLTFLYTMGIIGSAGGGGGD